MLPLLGPLETPLSLCFAMKVYQSSDTLDHSSAELRYKGSCIYICILRHSDVSKDTQQAYTNSLQGQKCENCQ